MTTPERDPLGAMFDQYAERTAAETTRATGGSPPPRYRYSDSQPSSGSAATCSTSPAGGPGGPGSRRRSVTSTSVRSTRLQPRASSSASRPGTGSARVDGSRLNGTLNRGGRSRAR